MLNNQFKSFCQSLHIKEALNLLNYYNVIYCLTDCLRWPTDDIFAPMNKNENILQTDHLC